MPLHPLCPGQATCKPSPGGPEEQQWTAGEEQCVPLAACQHCLIHCPAHSLASLQPFIHSTWGEILWFSQNSRQKSIASYNAFDLSKLPLYSPHKRGKSTHFLRFLFGFRSGILTTSNATLASNWQLIFTGNMMSITDSQKGKAVRYGGHACNPSTWKAEIDG